MKAHEGTSNVKSVKLFIYKRKFEKFALLPNEDLKTNFSRLNIIVNQFKDLGFDVPNVDISLLEHCLLNMRQLPHCL
jgi:hypothetical protein